MKTSIAMATYNGAEYIKEQLDSIAAQTHLLDELVVCDDGSTDGTLLILEQFKNEALFPVRIYRNSENLGYTLNFSKAIGLCQGDIIFLCDQDDVWLPQKVNTVLTTFSEHPDAGYVFSDAVLSDENLAPIGNLWRRANFSNRRYENYVDGKQVEAILKGGNFVYGNTLVFRARYCDIILPISSKSWSIAHDTWISLLLSATGVRGVAIPKELILYRQHTRQVTSASKRKSLKNIALAVMEDKSAMFLERANGLRAVNKRAKSVSNNSSDLLDQCCSHLEARASMYSQSSWSRMCTIFTELNSGRYFQFSSSLKSAFRDFIFVRKIGAK